MRSGDLTRPLALIFSRLGTQVTGRLVQLLQEPLREQVIEMLDDAAGLSPDRMVFVEQVLLADLLRLQEEAQHEEGSTLLQEVVPLQISDVVGFMLLHAPVQAVAEILLRLPAALQAEVLYKICVQNWSALARRLGRAELGFLRALEAGWREEGRSASSEFGAEVLAHIVSTAAVRRLLSEMYRLDPEVTVQVRDLLFGFQDLVRLSDREFQAVLAGVDAWDLALAMQTAPQNLRRRVLANISQRRASYLVEDEVALQDAAPEEVDAVQRVMLDVARRLFEQGKLATYLGSIQVDEPQGEVEAEEASNLVGNRPQRVGEPARKEGLRRNILVGIGMTVLVGIAFLWLAQLQPSGSRASSKGKSGALWGSSEVQRGGVPLGGENGATGKQEALVQETDFEFTEGDVWVRSGGENRAATGATLRPGDWVETGEAGRAVVSLWKEAGKVEVEAASSLQVGGEDQNRDTAPFLMLRLGNVWISVNHPGLEVRSPLAKVTGSEGTLYRLRVVLNATTTVSVARGTVWIESLGNAQTEHAVLGPGEAVSIVSGGGIERKDASLDGGPPQFF